MFLGDDEYWEECQRKLGRPDQEVRSLRNTMGEDGRRHISYNSFEDLRDYVRESLEREKMGSEDLHCDPEAC